MTTAADVEELKRQAHHHLAAYMAATAHLDCGNALAQHVNQKAAAHAAAFNAVMDHLQAIDPNAPAGRL